MEGSHSGLVRSLGKRVRLNGLQGFKSLTLRQNRELLIKLKNNPPATMTVAGGT